MSDLLGRGYSFPHEFWDGMVELAEAEESVEAAIRMLFKTRIGERFFLPEYGSELPSLIFEPADETTLALAKLYAKEAIERWIPRVRRVKVQASLDPEERLIELRIELFLINSPNPRVMVYPLYVQQDS